MLEEFKKFILKGDVVSLSTGVIIGGAFSKIVEGFTKGIVDPLLGQVGKLVGGTGQVGNLPVWVFDFGPIINSIIQFLITAAVIFFIIVKPFNLLMARMKKAEPAPAPAGPSDEVKLLTEIRDALKK
jgi:large conductance mechanosensitive channel